MTRIKPTVVIYLKKEIKIPQNSSNSVLKLRATEDTVNPGRVIDTYGGGVSWGWVDHRDIAVSN